MLEKVTSNVKLEPVLQLLSGEEIKGNQPEEARGYLIPTVNVIKAKPCENVMQSTNNKKRRNTVREF